jgi:hypothetical protein
MKRKRKRRREGGGVWTLSWWGSKELWPESCLLQKDRQAKKNWSKNEQHEDRKQNDEIKDDLSK